ncbi:hypothetical protein [Actinoplanes sp. NPDC051411]|uniref:hypothetical protein n=1 Tax=Actinoplanes sp. NPDC051411 TaxID=3155522 RepID=UPI0034410118
MNIDFLHLRSALWTVHTAPTLRELTADPWITDEVGVTITSQEGADGLALYGGTYTELADALQLRVDELRVAAQQQASDPYADDRADLAAILRVIRSSHPDAVSAHLSIRGEDRYDFEITDLIMNSGQPLSDQDPAALDTLRDRTPDLSANLRWRGVLREDKHGHAVLSVTSSRDDAQ